MLVKQVDVQCPHCGHPFHAEVDFSNGDQDYYEDCANCCNPIRFQLHVDELQKHLQVSVSTDND